MSEISYLKDLEDRALIDILFQSKLGNYSPGELQAIKKIITGGLLAKFKPELIINELSAQGGLVAETSQKLAITLAKGFGRIKYLQKVAIAEIEYFEYIGLPGCCTTKEFCDPLLDKIYHLSEILALKNGQLEPVLFFCGGFECRHDWEADPFHQIKMRKLNRDRGR